MTTIVFGGSSLLIGLANYGTERLLLVAVYLAEEFGSLEGPASFPKDSDPAKDSRADCVREFNAFHSNSKNPGGTVPLSVLAVKFIRIFHQLRPQAVSFPWFLLSILYCIIAAIYEYWVCVRYSTLLFSILVLQTSEYCVLYS